MAEETNVVISVMAHDGKNIYHSKHRDDEIVDYNVCKDFISIKTTKRHYVIYNAIYSIEKDVKFEIDIEDKGE